jgi:hypothetical protein
MQALDLLPLMLNFWTASAFFKVALKVLGVSLDMFASHP